jgi:beta-lactamase regulating signal transducer with metallopeptidase domain
MIPVETLNAWGAAWAGAMTRALVDASALLAVVLAVWLPLRRRMSAQLAHGLFCLVLLRLAVPQPLPWPSWLPSVSVREAVGRAAAWVRPADAPAPEAAPAVAPAGLELPVTGDLGPSAADAPAPRPVAVPVEDGPPRRPQAEARPAPAPARLSAPAVLMVAWAVTALLLLARLARAVGGTRRMIRDALPVDPEWIPVDVEALRKAIGVRRAVRWAVSPRLRTPAVGGLFRPTVVVPPDLEDGLTPQQLTWVLLHELAHVRRGDLWVVMGQRAVQSVFFFHPAVHAANWVIDQLREYACDDAALAACKASRRDCGEGFLTVVSRTVEPAPAAAAALGLFESRMLIRRRLVRILDPRRKVHARLSPRAAVGLLAAAAVALAFGRSRDAAAHPRGPLDTIPARSLVAAAEPEPLTFRPPRPGTARRSRARRRPPRRGCRCSPWPTRPTARPSRRPARTAPSRFATSAPAASTPGSTGTATPSPASRTAPTARPSPRPGTTGRSASGTPPPAAPWPCWTATPTGSSP